MKKSVEEIEKNYFVESVEYKGMQVWAFLRTYFSDKIFFNADPVKPGFALFFNFFSFCFYGFFNLFRKYDYLIFSSSGQRRKMYGKYFDKSIDKLSEIAGKSLVFELPVGKHYGKNEIPTQYIVSKYVLYFLVLITEKLFIKKPTIKNQNILDEILKTESVNFNYKSLIKKHYAQYLVMKFFIKVYKPKTVFLVCYYTNMGFIKALKEKNIKVVEIQHGVINRSHVAYNLYKPFDKNFFPDYLLTFGNAEKKIFNENNFFIPSQNVIPVGHFYIDYLSIKYNGDKKLKEISKKFHRVIAVTSQNIEAENEFVNFLKNTAAMDKNNLFIFIPRNSVEGIKQYNFPENIKKIDWLNTYEVIAQCHFHSTMYSTCAIEAPSLGVQNILINIKNYSKEHFGNILNNSLVTKYVETPEEYLFEIKNMKIIPKEEIIESNRENILPGYNENIKKIVNKILYK